ncbi:hypothetical protein G5I_01613 [Acromyrmex echinatior]|uniref:Uncharacterized protein n=1 Tax=Acromyrmex echinatior TaxID=103372 RepID=F4W836_ACREC|nr:hypothetical protein G5I_01613 [Acromyrmex echinatior]
MGKKCGEDAREMQKKYRKEFSKDLFTGVMSLILGGVAKVRSSEVHFSEEISNIRDWLTVEEEMLRQQSVVVGDVDEIMHLLDKQKSNIGHILSNKTLNIYYCGFSSSFHMNEQTVKAAEKARSSNVGNFAICHSSAVDTSTPKVRLKCLLQGLVVMFFHEKLYRGNNMNVYCKFSQAKVREYIITCPFIPLAFLHLYLGKHQFRGTGMTENNRFVTVALLLISDCEDAEEEIFGRVEGAAYIPELPYMICKINTHEHKVIVSDKRQKKEAIKSFVRDAKCERTCAMDRKESQPSTSAASSMYTGTLQLRFNVLELIRSVLQVMGKFIRNNNACLPHAAFMSVFYQNYHEIVH